MMNDFLMKAFKAGKENGETATLHFREIDEIKKKQEKEQYELFVEKSEPILKLIEILYGIESDSEGRHFQKPPQKRMQLDTTSHHCVAFENPDILQKTDSNAAPLNSFTLSISSKGIAISVTDLEQYFSGTTPYHSHHEPMKEIMRWAGRVAPHMEEKICKALEENPILDPQQPGFMRDFLHDGSLSQEIVKKFGLPKEGREIVKGWESTKRTNTRTPK